MPVAPIKIYKFQEKVLNRSIKFVGVPSVCL